MSWYLQFSLKNLVTFLVGSAKTLLASLLECRREALEALLLWQGLLEEGGDEGEVEEREREGAVRGVHEPVVGPLLSPDGEEGADDGTDDEPDGEGDPNEGHSLSPRLGGRVVSHDRRGEADVALGEPSDYSVGGGIAENFERLGKNSRWKPKQVCYYLAAIKSRIAYSTWRSQRS